MLEMKLAGKTKFHINLYSTIRPLLILSTYEKHCKGKSEENHAQHFIVFSTPPKSTVCAFRYAYLVKLVITPTRDPSGTYFPKKYLRYPSDMGIPAFSASLFPKREDAQISATPGSKLVPRAFAVEIKALRTRLVVQKKKVQEKKQQLFSQFQVEPLLGLKFQP